MNFIGKKETESGLPNNIGILICNLGTPDSYKYKDVRKFLNEFLSDHRVVEIPKIIWWFILNIFILTLRPFKSGKLYKSIWTKEGSPLMVFSIKLVEKLNFKAPKNVHYVLGMRYGNPSIEKAMLFLKEKRCAKIIVVPLFPQYSGTTTGSIFDAVSMELNKWRWVPNISFINGYYNNKNYIKAIAESLKKKIRIIKPEKIIFSYHGIPQRNFDKGDPYFYFCKRTTKLIVEELNISEKLYEMTFQSRFGPDKWLQPYTSETMKKLPKQGFKNILVLAPGFSMDCLETLEEINEENKNIFLNSGGKKFTYISCLNDSENHVSLIENIIKKHFFW